MTRSCIGAPGDQLVERLHADGAAAVADFSQDELETVIDDLPLALESESIRDHLPALLRRIDRRLERTFRRVIEIARQDEERVALLLLSLRELPWRGTPTEDEFAWLVQQMSRSLDPAARLAAFERAANLVLHEAQVARAGPTAATGNCARRASPRRFVHCRRRRRRRRVDTAQSQRAVGGKRLSHARRATCSSGKLG